MKYIFSVITLLFFSCLQAQNVNMVWAKNMGGSGASTVGTSIAVDASGNVYTTGLFTGTVDFDPGPGTYNLTTVAGSNDIWAKNMGGTSNGAIIKTINKGIIAAETYSIQLNLPNTNMYVVRLAVNGETFSKKIIK